MIIIAIYGREIHAEPLFEREKVATLKPHLPLRSSLALPLDEGSPSLSRTAK